MSVESRSPAPAATTCPACGGENAPEAVFCTHCHKALGDFKYLLEELRAETRWHETVAAKAAAFIGRPHFLAAHLVWFAAWVAINSGIVAFIGAFDAYPFQLLGIILAVEAIFITGFLLINNNREDARANKLAELDYEVNVRTYRELKQIDATLRTILERLDHLESDDGR